MKHLSTVFYFSIFIALCFMLGTTTGQASVPNDSCNHATVIPSLPDSIYENTTSATADPADPVLSCVSGTGDGKSVWFQYTADSTEFISISTAGSTPATPADSVYDTTLGLFTGACGALIQVACNDDINPGVIRQAQIIYQVTKGVTYTIFVGEWNGGGPSGGKPTGGGLAFKIDHSGPIIAVRGPVVGIARGGTPIYTSGFINLPLAKVGENELREAAENPMPPLLPPPANMVQALAPLGANYMEDRTGAAVSSPITPPHAEQNFLGLASTGYAPPDPIMAVGPNHVIAMVNSTMGIFNKNNDTVVQTIDLNSWYTHVHTPSGFSDPQVLYDHYARHWIMGGISTETPNFLYISVCDSDNPIGVWYNWAISLGALLTPIGASGAFNDQATFGFDDKALYIQTRVFNPGLSYNLAMIIPKSQLYRTNADSLTITYFYGFKDPDNGTNSIDHLKPFVSWGTPGKSFMMSAGPYALNNFITLWTIDDPIGTPSITGLNIPVTQYLPPPPIRQWGGGPALENVRNDIPSDVIYRDSSLWMAHAVSTPDGQSGAISYLRINPFTHTVLEDVSLGKKGYDRFYPSIMVNKDHDLIIGYSESGAQSYAGAFFTGRRESDPPGLAPSTPLKEGQDYYSTYSSSYPRNRWGDYNGTGLDPTDSLHIWYHGEFTGTGNSWGTQIGKLTSVPGVNPMISVDHSYLPFPKLQVDSARSDTVEVTLSNLGASDLSVSSVVRDSNYLVYSPDANIDNPFIIPALGSVRLEICFTPKTLLRNIDSIIITSNDPLQPRSKIKVTGTSFSTSYPVRGVLYATTGNQGNVYTVDRRTGAGSLIGSCGYDKVVSSRIDPVSGLWVGIVTPSSIVKISAVFGDANVIATLASPGIPAVKGMAFRKDTCYLGNGAGKIYRVNINTGAWTQVSQCPFAIAGMDFNPVTGELWATPKGGILIDAVYKVNVNTGAATLIGQTGTGVATQDIIFDGRGELYGLSGSNVTIGNLIKIDTSTGVGTIIGSVGSPLVQSLALIPDTLYGKLDYGLISTFDTKTDTLWIHNNGSKTLTFSNVIVDDPTSYTVNTTSGSINVGDSMRFIVTFNPAKYGAKPAAADIEFDSVKKYGAVLLSGSAYTPAKVNYAHLLNWNLVSVPITVPDLRKTVLFTDAISSAFEWANSTYNANDTLSYGKGYWLRYGGVGTDTISGLLGMSDTFTVAKSWNLIGSITTPALGSTITPIGTHVVSPVFGFGHGYARTDTVTPGGGYWLKVDSAGQIVLHSVFAKPKPQKNPLLAVLSSLNSVTMTDSKNNAQTLYFGNQPNPNEMGKDMYELPPVPPKGIFDARFSTGRYAEFVTDGATQEFPMEISSAMYPVDIQWNVTNTGSASWLRINDNDIPLIGSGEYTLNRQPANMSVRLKGTAVALPAQFALEQNYPNPFNPTTNIRYALPTDTRVTLKIYDVLGQEVVTLVDEMQSAGYKNVSWRSVNSAGLSVPSGMYFYRIQAGSFTQTKKLILLK
ncbi:MAG: T9SS type A sorting domain-containing protein [Bacteroidota bacterium]